VQLLIAIVNYRSAGMVKDLLDSLAQEVRGLAGVVVRVGDNGSGDDSVEALAKHVQAKGYGDFAEVLDLKRNGGFAFGNNRLIEGPLNGPLAERPDYVLMLNPDTLVRPGAIRALLDFMTRHPDAGLAGSRLIEGPLNGPLAERPDYVLMLNPDTLVRPGAIRALLDFMTRHPDAGLAGSRLIDPDGSVQASAFRFQGLCSEIDDGLRLGLVSKLLRRWKVAAPQPLDQPSQCQWVAGASLIVRREVFERIGLMDEAYFLYFEEEDFCRRAASAGFTCWYVPASQVVHLVGQTSGVTNKADQNRRKPGFWFSARQRYFVTHHGIAKSLLIDVAHLTCFLLWRLRRRLQGKPDPDPAHYALDILKRNLLASRRLPPASVPRVSSPGSD
jgi:N-acetylglucosaminyl-diphospho-decaprenol L-rhamnosyltransferase